ncbi:MAG: monothiol glutaredoxin, Grx4 family, partial [Burkholderiales bacterium]|nr:monothiol glutaredoxin, Grx4 family [Burkholderiales bacterium]
MSVQEKIKSTVTSNPVVLFMKGSPQMPMCGFSATATQILHLCGVENFAAIDVLQDPE